MFTAMITFAVVDGQKRVYSLAAGTAKDVGMMIEKFFKPNGYSWKTLTGFADQEAAQAEAERMYKRAAAKHGQVEVQGVDMSNPLVQAALS